MTLTAEQIDQMEAGPEMDRLVAEALGFTLDPATKFHPAHWLCDGRFVGEVSREGCDGEDIWRPSRDWNDAMAAAEKFGLFDKAWPTFNFAKPYLVKDGDWWRIYGATRTGMHMWILYAPSGPLAICRAILKLKAI